MFKYYFSQIMIFFRTSLRTVLYSDITNDKKTRTNIENDLKRKKTQMM